MSRESDFKRQFRLMTSAIGDKTDRIEMNQKELFADKAEKYFNIASKIPDADWAIFMMRFDHYEEFPTLTQWKMEVNKYVGNITVAHSYEPSLTPTEESYAETVSFMATTYWVLLATLEGRKKFCVMLKALLSKKGFSLDEYWDKFYKTYDLGDVSSDIIKGAGSLIGKPDKKVKPFNQVRYIEAS